MRRAQHILERRRATVGVTELKRRLDSSLPSSVGSREIDDSMAMTNGADQPSSSSTTPTVPSPTSLPAPYEGGGGSELGTAVATSTRRGDGRRGGGRGEGLVGGDGYKRKRRIQPVGICPICGVKEENGFHATVECTVARSLREAIREFWALPPERKFAMTGPDWLLVLLDSLNSSDKARVYTGANDQAATGHGGGGQGKKQKREGKREPCSLPIWASRGRRESA
uniref:Uncharacterized protein n=1 Tax=Oryza sativa subsp. japonica TaxID=39947 RepID=Q7XDV4_ORYSJ|nr:hypothetical protein LOC_Os10g31300 [Oryza sativa Japonica Group]